MPEPVTEPAALSRADGFEHRLRASVAGDVNFDAATRALYTMDASNSRQVPIGVVAPRAADDTAAAIAVAHEFDVPVVPRGGGTSLAGNAVGNGLVLDTSRYLKQIVDIDPQRRTARVQPGVILDDLRAAAAPHGLTFGPDPSTHSRCTLGGMIGNNSCGSHSVAWGTTADNLDELTVLDYSGEHFAVGGMSREQLAVAITQPGRFGRLYTQLSELVSGNLATVRQEFGRLSRQVSGYPLQWLLLENGHHLPRALAGTEGTCATVLDATVRLVELPAARVLLVLGFADDIAAADAVPAILPHRPLTVESMDERLVELSLRRNNRARPSLPDGGTWLFVELSGSDVTDAASRAQQVVRAVGATPHCILTDAAQQRALWRLREEGSGISTRMADGSEAWPGWEDAAVPPAQLGAYLRRFHTLLSSHGLRGITYGHFGEGCIHVRIDFDLVSSAGIAVYRRFLTEGAELVAEYGGSVSGEHGDGQARAELLPLMYSPQAMSLLERFKGIWDPSDRMNPGIIVRPYRADENLRFAALPQRELLTVFSYPHDDGVFGQALRRCVGIGKCRNKSGAGGTAAGAVMCPSFQVTGQEMHSTRGRAHLLYEMLAGEVITDGWRSPEVREALDLCLSCKGCASDCPVNVDMATYKAEFLHHHYARRLRPASHYSMGWLPLWLRLGAMAPRLFNATTRSPRLSRLLKGLGGIAPQRQLPELATQTFRAWHAASSAQGEGRPVLLWPDTFTNHFSPQVGRATVKVLRAAGFTPVLPEGPVCCGLTWVSTGQLGIAKRVMRTGLKALQPAIAAGIPIVGMEPSCLSTLRGEMTELLPEDPAATYVAQHSYTLAGLLAEYAPRWTPPVRERDAVVQVHCHQHATLGFDAERRLLSSAGVSSAQVPAGCCGLAGNFGFEKGHYEVSQALAEQALLPAVRAADPDTVIIADGFSCRTQVGQASPRHAVHLAEILAEGLAE